MRTGLWAGAMLAGMVLASGAWADAAKPAPGPADAKFQAIYKAEWAWRKIEFPGERGDAAAIPDRLGKVDAATQTRRLEHWTGVLKELDGVAEKDLSPDEAVNYEVYKDQIATRVAQQHFREYEKPFN
jgi:uncharacterized protein (DUF885 family)